jgi:hypothetical protein
MFWEVRQISPEQGMEAEGLVAVEGPLEVEEILEVGAVGAVGYGDDGDDGNGLHPPRKMGMV